MDLKVWNLKVTQLAPYIITLKGYLCKDKRSLSKPKHYINHRSNMSIYMSLQSATSAWGKLTNRNMWQVKVLTRIFICWYIVISPMFDKDYVHRWTQTEVGHTWTKKKWTKTIEIQTNRACCTKNILKISVQGF